MPKQVIRSDGLIYECKSAEEFLILKKTMQPDQTIGEMFYLAGGLVCIVIFLAFLGVIAYRILDYFLDLDK